MAAAGAGLCLSIPAGYMTLLESALPPAAAAVVGAGPAIGDSQPAWVRQRNASGQERWVWAGWALGTSYGKRAVAEWDDAGEQREVQRKKNEVSRRSEAQRPAARLQHFRFSL